MLLDVSPQLDGRRGILFLPDPAAVYDPLAPRSNILEAEGDDPIANEFVDAGRECLAIMHRYRRLGIAQPLISAADNLRLLQLRMRMEVLSAHMID
jgi:hypothetical protein